MMGEGVCAHGGEQKEEATDQDQGQLPAERYVLLCCVTKWKSPLHTHNHTQTPTHTYTHRARTTS